MLADREARIKALLGALKAREVYGEHGHSKRSLEEAIKLARLAKEVLVELERKGAYSIRCREEGVEIEVDLEKFIA